MSTPEDPYSTPPGGAEPSPPVPPTPAAYSQPPAAPGYGQPTYGQPPVAPVYGQATYGPPRTGTNGLAIAALVCSLAGLVTCISAPVGAVLGFVALSQIKKNPQEGRGLALAGAWIGSILTALGVIGLVALIAFGAWFANDIENTCTRSDYSTQQGYDDCISNEFTDRIGIDDTTASLSDLSVAGPASDVRS